MGMFKASTHHNRLGFAVHFLRREHPSKHSNTIESLLASWPEHLGRNPPAPGALGFRRHTGFADELFRCVDSWRISEGKVVSNIHIYILYIYIHMYDSHHAERSLPHIYVYIYMCIYYIYVLYIFLFNPRNLGKMIQFDDTVICFKKMGGLKLET